MATAGGLNARQRKQVYLHSAIFAEGGPDTQSVYSAERQGAVYQALEGNLRRNNLDAPEITLPKPEDMRITEYSGHQGIVFPHGTSGFPEQPRSLAAKTNAERLVHDGEIEQVVHSRGRDESIPREFWATSVNLQWHDTRHEQCRGRGLDRPAPSARDHKFQELSSEVLGSQRLTQPSTTSARRELLADTVDHLHLDSQRMGHRPLDADARARSMQNLGGSTKGLLPVADGSGFAPPSAEETAPENPANMPRRRQEKNFSDLFDAQMGERNPPRGKREEILSTGNVSFLDARTEVASRNKGHWKHDESQTAANRKHLESSSQLFDRNFPDEPPPVDPEFAKVTGIENSLRESKDFLRTSVEVARRRVAKDYQKDFDDPENLNHHARKQKILSSNPVFGFGGGPLPPGCGSAGAPPLQPRPVPGSVPAPSARSAKDTKLASLQSSIFG